VTGDVSGVEARATPYSGLSISWRRVYGFMGRLVEIWMWLCERRSARVIVDSARGFVIMVGRQSAYAILFIIVALSLGMGTDFF
jgi:hypothetical protein